MSDFEKDLLDELTEKHQTRSKRLYKREKSKLLKNRKVNVAQDVDNLILTKVQDMSKNISDKYKIKEESVYEDLYLRVRRMFLEMM